MTASFNIEVNRADVKDAVSLFEFVGGNTADALRIAINKTAPKVRTTTSRAIRDQVRLSASYVNERITVVKATRAKLTGAIKTPSRGLLLSRFSTDSTIAGDNVSWIRPPKVPKTGIRVKIKPDGGAKAAPGLNGNKPFYIVLNGGKNVGIAARLGSSKKGIKVFSGPSLSQVFDSLREKLLPGAADEYQFQLLDAMRFILVKKHPLEPVL